MTTILQSHLALAAGGPEVSILRVLVSLGMRVVGADEGSLLVLDRATDELVFAMTVGGSEATLLGQRIPLGTGLTGLAAATREVQIGAPTYAGVAQARDHGAASGPTAVIAAPMLVGDDLLGVITAVRFAAGARFTGDDADLYAQVAAIAGVVVMQRRRIADEAATESEVLEQAIARSIGRIARARADGLTHVANMLASLELLVGAT